ncbi:MAG: diacylglycerol/lipid kinase family protein [Bacillota bacterium]
MEYKMLAVVNPASAGKATGKEWPDFERRLRELGFKFDAQYTERKEHAIEITREALKNGYNYIISVGGDGTMNEVLNGFFEEGVQINPDARLAVFSRGTGCDFIKSIGIKKGFDDFVQLLHRDQCKRLDIGIVTYKDYEKGVVSRYFLNISDLGLGGDTTNRINKTAKSLKGFLSFAINAILSILLFRNKHYTISIDDNLVVSERLNSVIVANGRYFGSGMEVAPLAKMDDGIFDIVVLGDLNTFELIKSFPSIYKGQHLKNPKVKVYNGKKVKVSSEPYALLDIDGEQPGMTEAEFEIIPNSINVMV